MHKYLFHISLIGYEPQRRAWCDHCRAVLDYRIEVLSSIYPREYPPQPTKAAIMPSLYRACTSPWKIQTITHPTAFSSIILSIILIHSQHTHSQPDQEAIPSSVPGVSSPSIPILIQTNHNQPNHPQPNKELPFPFFIVCVGAWVKCIYIWGYSTLCLRYSADPASTYGTLTGLYSLPPSYNVKTLYWSRIYTPRSKFQVQFPYNSPP